MNQKKIDRINELYHKSKTDGLTEVEKREQMLLRREYIDSVKRNLTVQLDQISIQEVDGRITSLKELHYKKRGI